MTETLEKKNPLSVVFVSDLLAERSINKCSLNLGKGLIKRGHKIRIVSPGGEMESDFASAGMDVEVHKSMSMPVLNLFALRKCSKSLRAGNARLIHIQSQDAAIFGAGLCSSTGLPGVITVHRFDFPRRLASLKNIRIIAVSEALREHLVNDAKIPKEIIDVVPNSVDIARYKMTGVLEDPDRIPVVGSVGRMEPVRGLKHFIKAAKIVLDSGIKAEFVIVGQGNQEKPLRQLVATLGLTEHFTFVLESADYSRRINSMDMVVVSSEKEGFGMVALEAMSCGRPVIASGVGGIYSLIKDGDNGLIVPPRDPDAIAERVIGLLRNPEKAIQLGNSARKTVEENFTVDVVAEKTESVYRKALGE